MFKCSEVVENSAYAMTHETASRDGGEAAVGAVLIAASCSEIAYIWARDEFGLKGGRNLVKDGEVLVGEGGKALRLGM